MPKVVRSGIITSIPVIKKKLYINRKPRLLSPILEHICLTLGEGPNHTFCLAFDDFALYGADQL